MTMDWGWGWGMWLWMLGGLALTIGVVVLIVWAVVSVGRRANDGGNVVLREDKPGITAIEVLDPVVALSIAGESSIMPIASEARERLSRVVAAIEG